MNDPNKKPSIEKAFQQVKHNEKVFIQLHELAKKEKNEKMQAFYADILKVYQKHDINGHIEWKR